MIGGHLMPYKPFTGIQWIYNFKKFCYNTLRLISKKSKEDNHASALFFRCFKLTREKEEFKENTRKAKDEVNKVRET